MIFQRNVTRLGHDYRERRLRISLVEAERELLGPKCAGANHHGVNAGTQHPHRLAVDLAAKPGGLPPYGDLSVDRADHVEGHVRSRTVAMPWWKEVQILVNGGDLP